MGEFGLNCCPPPAPSALINFPTREEYDGWRADLRGRCDGRRWGLDRVCIALVWLRAQGSYPRMTRIDLWLGSGCKFIGDAFFCHGLNNGTRAIPDVGVQAFAPKRN